MSNAGEVNVETFPIQEGQTSTLGSEVKAGMFSAAGTWLKEHNQASIYEVRMAMWQQIHDALPSGKLRELHGKTRGFAELDAQVARWSGKGKNTVWAVARDAIAAEFPPVLLLPDNTPSIMDAWSARIGGVVGEAMIRGGVNVKQRIDQIMASITSGAMKPIAQGGVA